MPVWLIPEGSTPFDGTWAWRRALTSLDTDNPYAALCTIRNRGIDIEAYWWLDDGLWVAGYDMTEALREGLSRAGTVAHIDVCWERCELTIEGRSWSGALRSALEATLALEPGLGVEALFVELAGWRSGNVPCVRGECEACPG